MTTTLDHGTRHSFSSENRRLLIFGADKVRDSLLVACRVLLMILFIKAGWSKLTGFPLTVQHFTHSGVPFPVLAACVAVAMEFFAGIAVVLGLLTRTLAIALAVYTLGTALLGHHYWTLQGRAQIDAEINFFKNVSIMGGFFLLYLTGAGRYSIDKRIGLG